MPFLVLVKVFRFLTSNLVTVISGAGIRGLMRGMATLPQANQELLVVRVVTATSIVLSFNRHWLTQVHLENGR